MDRLYLDNDHVVTLQGPAGVGGLQDADGATKTAATVEVRVLDRNLAEVSGETWPVTATHQGAGVYTARLDKAVSLTVGELYYVEVTASEGQDDATWRVPHVAQQRE